MDQRSNLRCAAPVRGSGSATPGAEKVNHGPQRIVSVTTRCARQGACQRGMVVASPPSQRDALASGNTSSWLGWREKPGQVMSGATRWAR